MASSPTYSNMSDGRSSPGPRKQPAHMSRERAGSPLVSFDDPDRNILPGEMAPPAFSDFKDYSKHNSGRHANSRLNTFSTPTSMSSKVSNVPGRLDKRWNLGDTKTLQEICDKGFAASAAHLGTEVMTEMRIELAQTSAALHAELTQEGREREAKMDGVLGQMMEIMEQVQDFSKRPPDFGHADLSPFREEIHNGTTAHLEGLRSTLNSLEQRFSKDVHDVHNEVLSVSKFVNEVNSNIINTIKAEFQKTQEGESTMGMSLEGLVRRAEEKISKVVETQNIAFPAATELQQKLHEEQVAQNRTLEEAVEIHMTKLVEEQSAREKESNKKVLETLGRTVKQTSSDTRILMGELAKIQKALNVDFAHMVDELHHDFEKLHQDACDKDKADGTKGVERGSMKMLAQCAGAFGTPAQQGLKVKKRVREYFSQTEPPDVDDQWTQTDASLMKDSKKKKKKEEKKDNNRNTAVKVAEKKGGAMFADADAMKAKMREAMIKPQYNVTDFYHESGIFQRIAQNPVFENVTLFVIFANSIWIAIDTDLNPEAVLLDADIIFQIAEHFFCSFFTSELFIRFMAFNGKKYCLRDRWFCFDSVLVCIMIVETWVLTAIFAFADPDSVGGRGNT